MELEEHLKNFKKIVKNDYVLENEAEFFSLYELYEIFPEDVEILTTLSMVYFLKEIIYRESSCPYFIPSLANNYLNYNYEKQKLNNFYNSEYYASKALKFSNKKNKIRILEWLYSICINTGFNLTNKETGLDILNNAKIYIKDLIELKPKKKKYWSALSKIIEYVGTSDEIVNCFKKNIELNSKDSHYYVKMYPIFYKIKKGEDAENLLEELKNKHFKTYVKVIYSIGKKTEELNELSFKFPKFIKKLFENNSR